MRIAATGVAVPPALHPTDARLEPGTATVVVAEGGLAPTALALVLAGRMAPGDGEVDASDDAGDPLPPRAHRDAVAIVDAPSVNEPDAGVSVGALVAEGTALAGRARRDEPVQAALDRAGVARRSLVPLDDLAPGARTDLLAELAAARPAVRAVVLVSPDRHGGDPADWWRTARRLAARGLAVLAIVGAPAAAALADDAVPPTADAGPTLFDLADTRAAVRRRTAERTDR